MKPDAIPEKKLSLDEVIERWPRIRQSTLANHDDCALSAYFEMRYTGYWSNLPAASGTIFHRFCAAVLKYMREADAEFIDVGIALGILAEVLEQRDVEPHERVRIPLREVPNLRWMAVKFAKDNRFSIRHVVDVEHRLEAPIEYRDDDGELRTRILTGQLDALIADPAREEEAIIIDWKSGWGLPPRRPENADDPGLSYHGFFQQRFYGWLVMKNYPHIKAVTLREFYTRRTEARPARIERSKLEEVEEDLARAVRELDLALASGPPKKLQLSKVAPWNPAPGKHCAYCVGASQCPIESSARERHSATSQKQAERMVAELEIAESIRGSHREALRQFVDLHGPVGARWSKGRRAFGYKTQKNGKPILTFFTPEGTDRAPERAEEDAALEEALKASAEAAKEGR
jgi:hypothetical protein